MPAPMPPPGGAPPQGPQGQGGPPPPQGGPEAQGGQGGGVAALMMNVDKALDHIMQVIHTSPAASPQEKQLIQVANQAFGKLMDSVSGGSEAQDPEEDGEAQGQTTSPEAGGNKGAIPSPV